MTKKPEDGNNKAKGRNTQPKKKTVSKSTQTHSEGTSKRAKKVKEVKEIAKEIINETIESEIKDGAKAEEKDKGGRPKKEFDPQQFETLCGMMCTLSEICNFFQTTDKTIEKWVKETYGESFSVIYKRFSINGTISLRRAQFKSAIERGNVTMQIWLGKQFLGQSESLILSSNLDQETINTVEDFINGTANS